MRKAVQSTFRKRTDLILGSLSKDVLEQRTSTGSEAFSLLKVPRYSFSRSIPPKFEHKLRRHKQRFGKIATTVVLDKDENLL